jgi:hypothetical protein
LSPTLVVARYLVPRCRQDANLSRLEAPAMKDVVYVLLTLVFFLLSWLYVRACERV